MRTRAAAPSRPISATRAPERCPAAPPPAEGAGPSPSRRERLGAGRPSFGPPRAARGRLARLHARLAREEEGRRARADRRRRRGALALRARARLRQPDLREAAVARGGARALPSRRSAPAARAPP